MGSPEFIPHTRIKQIHNWKKRVKEREKGKRWGKGGFEHNIFPKNTIKSKLFVQVGFFGKSSEY